MNSVKDMISNNKAVNFSYYRSDNLWYSTECGFVFPVPIVDIGEATFKATDKAILFMRYIRKYRTQIEAETNGS